MTDKEKQIEEITTIIDSVLGSSPTLVLQSRVNGGKYKSIKNSEIAEELYNAGYRKIDEITLKLDLGDRSAEEIQQIAEAFNKAMANEQTLVTVPSNEEEIAKRVAKEIYKRVDEFRKSPDLDPRDSYDCNALDAYNNVCKFINRKYGVEIKK